LFVGIGGWGVLLRHADWRRLPVAADEHLRSLQGGCRHGVAGAMAPRDT
jgi:hypothetical protein